MRPLKSFVLLGSSVLLAFCPALPGAEPPSSQAPPAFRFHFAGAQLVSSSSDGAVLKRVAAAAQSAKLEQHILHKIARAIAGTNAPNSQELADLLRPVLADLIRSESVGEWHSKKDSSALSWVIAADLSIEQKQRWVTQLNLYSNQVAQAAGPQPLAFRFEKTWGLLASDPDLLKENSSLLREISSAGRAKPQAGDFWLECEADRDWVRRQLAPLRARHWPAVQLSVAGRPEGLRWTMRLRYDADQNWPLEKWQIPAESISDPEQRLISFTAVQGIRPALAANRSIQNLKLPSVPNQAYSWALGHIPIYVNFAVPLPGVTNFLASLRDQMLPQWNTNLQRVALGQVELLADGPEFRWRGLPLMVPYLQPVTEPAGQFLLGGFFPTRVQTNPAPGELYQQLTSRSNLVYYDWEITEARASQLRQLTGLIAMAMNKRPPAVNLVATEWLEMIRTNLGNTITAALVESPREIEVVRTSHLGFTGIELVLLTSWIDELDFPALDWAEIFRFNPPTARRARPQSR